MLAYREAKVHLHFGKMFSPGIRLSAEGSFLPVSKCLSGFSSLMLFLVWSVRLLALWARCDYVTRVCASLTWAALRVSSFSARSVCELSCCAFFAVSAGRLLSLLDLCVYRFQQIAFFLLLFPQIIFCTSLFSVIRLKLHIF